MHEEEWRKNCHLMFPSVTNKASPNAQPKAGAFSFLLSSPLWISIFVIENRNSSLKHFSVFATRTLYQQSLFKNRQLFHSTGVPKIFTLTSCVVCQCECRREEQVWPGPGDRRVIITHSINNDIGVFRKMSFILGMFLSPSHPATMSL